MSECAAEGRDWPARAHTMIGFKRLANIRTCVETVLDDGVPGDLIETGVWRGGAFRDTLPTAPINRLAILRLDGDLFESTIQALDSLYDKL